jgi:1-acyl-sn-glycerol-3-phosphate acyltransferase
MIIGLFKLLLRLKGFKVKPTTLPEGAKRSVLIAAPHTSNWDFVYAIAALYKLGLFPRFTIKKEFNKPIIGRWMESIGALWIDRSPKVPGEKRLSMVNAMVNVFDERKEENLVVVVTPEGTRSKRTEWKTGFYHVAVGAGVPISLAYMDYEKKETGVGKVVYPSGDMEADMKEIMDFYRDIPAKFPKNFSIDQRYDSAKT